jgi:hypothetical protein
MLCITGDCMDMTATLRVSRKSLLLPSLLIAVLVSSLFVCVFGDSSCVGFLDGVVHVKNEAELRNAINNASSKEVTIALDNDITLTESSLTIHRNKNIVLTSNRASGFYKLTGVAKMSVIVVDGGVLKLDGIIVSGGGSNGGGIFVLYGVFVMYDGEISGNTADGGGGGVSNGGNFSMFGGTISGNTASSGGGVYTGGGANFDWVGGVISGNTATENGNNVYPDGGGSGGNNGGGPSMWGGFSLRDVVLICVGVAIVVVGIVVAVLLFTFKKELKHTKEKTI